MTLDFESRKPSWTRDACCFVALVLAGVAALAVDVPVARWFGAPGAPSWPYELFVKLVTLSEAFAHGVGVTMILVVVWSLDPLGWRVLPRLGIASLGAGLLANLSKLIVQRTRPRFFDFQGGVLDTFGGWAADFQAESWELVFSSTSAEQSFPSSHTAAGIGLALALADRYPRGRFVFFALAVLAALQRIQSRAHWVSDTLWGAAIGYGIAAVCLAAVPIVGRR